MERNIPLQAIEFGRKYYDPVLSATESIVKDGNWVPNAQPSEINRVNDVFRNAASGFFELLPNPETEQISVSQAIEKKRITQVIDLFRQLYPKDDKDDYYSILEKAYRHFVSHFEGDLPADTPKTFESLLVAVIKEKSRELLQPTGEKEAAEEKDNPVVLSSDQKKELEDWKNKWFKGKITLIERIKNFGDKIMETVFETKDDPKDVLIRRYNFLKEKIPEIQNLDEIREVSVAWLNAMFSSSEVQQESYRTEIIDLLRLQALQLAQAEKTEVAKEKAIFTAELLQSSRDLYFFWWEGWMGKESGQGSSVSMVTVATAAAKFDRTGSYAFLMKQKAIAIASHTQDVKKGRRIIEKLKKFERKESVWDMMGYMLRASTGMGSYDGLAYFTVADYKKIQGIVDEIRPLETVSDTPEHALQNEVKIRELELRLNNVVSEMVGSITPDSQFYVEFLNKFVPWYLNVRYRHKFKDRIDFMKQQSKFASKFINDVTHNQGFIDEEAVKRLMEQFRYFNIAETGAYSEHKRPDTYNSAWEQNLRIISALSTDSRVRLEEREYEKATRELRGMQQKIVEGEDSRISDVGARKINEEVDMLDRARAIYMDYKNDVVGLNEMMNAGLNFAMKMISIYEPGRDKRSMSGSGTRKSSYTDWESVFGLAPTQWEAEVLLSFDQSRKATILRDFLSPKVSVNDRAEIVKNNLIRTVEINTDVMLEIRKLERSEQNRMESFFDTHIYTEFVSMDDLFAKHAGENGDTWMRYFDQGKFSANAYMIYSQYAESDRKLVYQVFAEETDPGKLLQISEEFKASKSAKHLIDTARLQYSRETHEGFYDHATAWRLERVHKAIEAYVSQLYIMSIAAYRRKGIREPVAENVVSMVRQGVNESWLQDYHFEPAMSKRERQRGEEYSYAKIESQRKMGNDYKLRYLLNLLGFEGNDQRLLWENGFVANLNKRTPYVPEKSRKFDKKNPHKIDKEFADNPNMIDYDTILLMAGVHERRVYKEGEVNGYEIDEDLANVWFDFYAEARSLGDRTPQMENFSPQAQAILLDRAKKSERFAGKNDVFIRNSLNRQFVKLHDAFNNDTYGYFSQIFAYEKNITFVWDKVVDAYIQNTFDLDKRNAYSVAEQKEQMGGRFAYFIATKFFRYDPSKWLPRDWDPEINYMRREAFKSQILRRRKFAIDEEAQGFNKFIVSQVIDHDVEGNKIPPRVINSYDLENHDPATGQCLMLHGVDVIESWLVGSGEIGFGTDWRLTRLPIGYDPFALLALYEAVFAPETAKKAHRYSGEPEWETGKIKSIKDRTVVLGSWAEAMTPDLREELYNAIKDPGGSAVMGTRTITEIKERNGCSPEQVERYKLERVARDVADLESGVDESLSAESAERMNVLDRSSKILFDLPNALSPEIGGLFNLKELTNIFKSSRNFAMTMTNSMVLSFPLSLAVTIVGGGLTINPLTFAGLTVASALALFKRTITKNDLLPTKRYGFNLFHTRLPWWKWVAMNSPRFLGMPLFALPIIGGTILASKSNLREQGRDSEVMIQGREPVYDSAISKKIIETFVKSLAFYKEKLDLSSASIEKRAAGH